MHPPSTLAQFEASVFAACCAQFPRQCSACKRPHPTFLEYVEATRPVGAPKLDPDDDEADAIGLLAFANCKCGSTLAIRYEDISQHAAFNAAVRREMEATGLSDAEVLKALVERIHARARTSPTTTTANGAAPDQLLLDVGAAMVGILRRESIKVPPFPAVAFKVAELAREPNSTPEQIAKVISSDATLAAELLHLVNAPVYARGKPVTSLPMAVTRLGMKEVARLAIASGVAGATTRPGPLAPVRVHLWHHSVLTATVARALAAKRQLPLDEGFLTGLLAPLGSIVGTLSLEVYLAQNPAFPSKPLAWWLRVLELFRTELGAVTAHRWNLPRSLAEALTAQAGTDSKGCEAPAMIDLVLDATQVARVMGEVDEVTDASLTSAARLSADERSHLSRVLPQLTETVAALEEGPPVKPAPSQVLAEPALSAAPPPATDVFVVNARAPAERFRVVSFSPRALVVEGKSALPEHVLTSLEVDVKPPLKLCAVARSCTAQGSQHRIALAPLALSAETLQQLRALTRPA
ncbi:MAG: HDOD domain-containing protein [Myxococcus sp.]|nr:HDOD domain-containing protein [Myxococcus sp.]